MISQSREGPHQAGPLPLQSNPVMCVEPPCFLHDTARHTCCRQRRTPCPIKSPHVFTKCFLFLFLSMLSISMSRRTRRGGSDGDVDRRGVGVETRNATFCGFNGRHNEKKGSTWQNQRKHTSLNTKLRKVLAGEISRAFLQSTPQSSAPLPLPTYLVMYTYLGAGLDPCK